jgi:anti-anti-sigma regulatory factor
MTEASRHLQVRQIGDIKVVRFEGLERKVHEDQSVQEIGEALYLLVGPGMPPKVILDFEDAPFVPWAHFESSLVGLHKRILKAGGLLKMANLHPSILETFHINRLDTIFSIYDSVGDALDAFGVSAQPIENEGGLEDHPLG